MGLYQLLPRDRRPAIVEANGRSISFEALAESAGQIGGFLHSRLGVGGRVLLLQPMGIDLYRLVSGLFASGSTGVIVDPAMGFKLAREAVRRVGVQGMAGPPLTHVLRFLSPSLWRGLALSGSWVPGAVAYDSARGGQLPQSFPGDTPALITFTTGSTGRPKAMARSHDFLACQHAVLSAHRGLRPDDVDLATLPVFALSSLASGATVILPDANLRRPGSVQPSRVLPQMRARGITTVSASPAFLEPLADTLIHAGDTFGGLRSCFTGGARVSSALASKLVRAFPNARVEVVYGSTEAEPIATLDVREHLETLRAGERDGRGALVGKAVPQLELRIVQPGTLETAAVGEVVVTGAHVNRSYWHDPEADAANKLPDGGRVWHRTGDTGHLDAAGQLWLVGRVADMVGELHPFPLEMAAERVSGVRRAALMGTAETNGRATAVICYEGEPGREAAIRSATGIERVQQAPGIPVDPRHNAKIDRKALRNWLASRG